MKNEEWRMKNEEWRMKTGVKPVEYQWIMQYRAENWIFRRDLCCYTGRLILTGMLGIKN